MINRRSTTQLSATVATTVAASTEIQYGEWSSGMVHIPSGVTTVTLTWYTAEIEGGTYLAAQDYNGTAVTQTVAASKSYPIPLALIGAVAIKAKGDAAGSMHVTLKG